MNEQTPDFYIKGGNELLEAGRIKKALNVFEEGVRIHGNRVRLLLGESEALSRMKRWKGAERVLLKLLKQNPKNMPALRKISKVYFQQKRWGDALVIYHKIVKINPQAKIWTAAKVKICQTHVKPDLSDTAYKSFVFTHIQKTGGASLREYIEEATIRSGFAPEELYIPGHHGVKALDNLIMLYENQLEKVRERQPIILADHSHYNPVDIFKIASLVDPFYYVMIREPIERIKSHYYYQYFKREDSGFYQTHLNDLNDHDLDEILRLLSNYHIVYMTGYDFWNRGYEADEAVFEQACEHLRDKYQCFGIFKHINTSVEILKEHAPQWLKFEGKLPKKNKSVKEKDESVLSERVLKRIKELNELDIKFYEFATQLFESRYLDEYKQMKKKPLPKVALAEGRFYFSPKYKTDKFESGLMHEYINVLQGLRYQPIKLLEIGVAEGGSVNYFSDYFQHPDAEIIGMDYQKPLQNPGFRENINFIIGDQNDPERLNEIGTKFGPFDVIIDDGAHTFKETRHTYDCLFQYVKPGGYFIIEDWTAEFIDSEKYAGMIDLMLQLYRENIGVHSNEITLKMGHGFSYLLIRKKV